MEKPITIQIEDTRQAIIDVVNNSNLHPFILDTILQGIYNEIHMLYRNQVSQEKMEYRNSQDNEESSN